MRKSDRQKKNINLNITGDVHLKIFICLANNSLILFFSNSFCCPRRWNRPPSWSVYSIFAGDALQADSTLSLGVLGFLINSNDLLTTSI
jgi:hypothetical protein